MIQATAYIYSSNQSFDNKVKTFASVNQIQHGSKFIINYLFCSTLYKNLPKISKKKYYMHIDIWTKCTHYIVKTLDQARIIAFPSASPQQNNWTFMIKWHLRVSYNNCCCLTKWTHLKIINWNRAGLYLTFILSLKNNNSPGRKIGNDTIPLYVIGR